MTSTKRAGTWLISLLALLRTIAFGQSTGDLQQLVAPQSLELSSDGSRVWYKLDDWWQVDTVQNSQPKRVERLKPEKKNGLAAVPAAVSRLSSSRKSPDGKKIAYLDTEVPYGPQLLFCTNASRPESGHQQPLSRIPIVAFQWARDSRFLWVIAVNGADEPIGRMTLDGRFEQLSRDPAMRRMGGLAAGDDTLAWIQSDGSHYGAICVRDRKGRFRVLVDPNPQTSNWSKAWTQQVVRWKNTHGEELQGVLASPIKGDHLPLLVDPYSSWRNRFLNIPVLGNYVFVKAGFAVFFPDHRAPHSFPQIAFGEAYVGASKDRDPVDVLTDDVMSGVAELVRRGIADPDQLYLYSASNGASAIDQLLTQTHAFRAAVSFGGVSNWLGYYEVRQPLGDETIPGFWADARRKILPIYIAESHRCIRQTRS